MTRETRAILISWLKGHLMDASELDACPKLGLIVSHCNVPVGVAFIRQIEGGKGLIDGFLSDPECELSIRTKALDLLILDLIELAKANRMSGLIGLTVNPRVIKRAKKLGFSHMDHTLVSMAFHCSTWNNLGDY